MTVKWFKNLAILCISLLGTHAALGCTDVLVVAKDKTVIVGRTMEFAADLHSNFYTSPRGRTFTNSSPDGKPTATWKSQYGYLYLDGMNFGTTIDGMNEKGLSFEYLFMPGFTTYQSIKPGQEAQAVPYLAFGDWVLGNFATVEEVKQALSKIQIYAQTNASLQNVVFPLHASIHDASGKGLVVEFINGEMKVYDNTLGVMTNAPEFSWHMINLRNYVNLSPYTSDPVTVDGIVFPGTGQGAGMQGLPGDPSPPSRFVKMIFLSKTATPVADAVGALNLLQHILNNVDIPFGFVRAKSAQGDVLESTEWTVYKDLTHKVMYFHTYNDMTLRSIDMSQLNFSPTAKRLKMPLEVKPYVMNITSDLQKSTL
jgi:choloylglycine hydrolase